MLSLITQNLTLPHPPYPLLIHILFRPIMLALCSAIKLLLRIYSMTALFELAENILFDIYMHSSLD